MVLIATAGALAIAASVPLGCGDDAAPADPGDAAIEAATPDANVASDAGVDAAVVPRGTRVLGVSVVVGDLDFQKNVRIARDGGATTTNVSFAWDDVERPYDAGAVDAGDDAGDAGDAAARTPTQIFNPLLHVANLVLPDEQVGATLTLDALDVGGSRAPAELATLPLDDAELATRYDRLTDYALDQLPDVKVSALLVASDVDVTLGDDPAKYAAFTTFVTRAAAHVHALRPKLAVGFVVSVDGAVAKKDRLAAAWAAADFVGVTYLPVDGAARVRPAPAVASDLDRLVAAVPAGRPVVVREAGYPTSAACGSDEASQVAFVSAMFGAWDRHADRITAVTFRELVDADPGAAAALAMRAGRTDAPFLAFLQSLGLRSAGRTKPGFDAWIRDARARGF
ncbi:MAG: hypothetical protein JWP87_6532 [Labilithrix sp.]|nr:hypothetical protein [Labilithrix sp.]